MENNNNTQNLLVADFDMALIAEFFKGVTRQGPGSIASTLNAVKKIQESSQNAQLFNNEYHILDIGCGTGTQTLVLADYTQSKITATDLIKDFLSIAQQKVLKKGLSQRVNFIEASMDNLPFATESYDVIWAEGSIFIIGFEQGLKDWYKFIKPGGYIAVTDCSWFTNERPNEIEQYWKDNYPQIDTVENKIKILQECGYEFIEAFNLPDECWIDNFYQSMQERIELFRSRYRFSQGILNFVNREAQEIDLYMKYRQYYGYTFFIGRKPMK